MDFKEEVIARKILDQLKDISFSLNEISETLKQRSDKKEEGEDHEA